MAKLYKLVFWKFSINSYKLRTKLSRTNCWIIKYNEFEYKVVNSASRKSFFQLSVSKRKKVKLKKKDNRFLKIMEKQKEFSPKERDKKNYTEDTCSTHRQLYNNLFWFFIMCYRAPTKINAKEIMTRSSNYCMKSVQIRSFSGP